MSKRSRKCKYSEDDDEYRSKYHRKKSPPPQKYKQLIVYKNELNRFLDEQTNIEDNQDFWKFYEKYQTIQQTQQQRSNRTHLINLEFSEYYDKLYDRLPVLDQYGERLLIERNDFNNFLLIIRLYKDFQQKMKFNKLKQLRQQQHDLPITKYKHEILEKLHKNRVLLIAGDTGCGKSTQIPQYIYQYGYKRIVCTQPRRIACISLSKRVAYETLTEYRNTVGYQIRFEKTRKSDTAIVFMTEGLLLRQIQVEELIKTYDIIILDEIHERHLQCDFLIGVMKCMLYKNNKFKLILMSATINLELFKRYFQNEGIEVICCPGRLYPIDIIYRPIIKDVYCQNKDKFDCTPYLQIIQMIDEKFKPYQKGDLLIFLNGFNEIQLLTDAIRQYNEIKKSWIILQLHSSLSIEEQDKVFNYPPEGIRKCIISTNIAETSITIDGIRFVIDSGKVNRMIYYKTNNLNKLIETNISQDSAKQRCGRAGRTGPGICYRLYSEEDLSKFDQYTPAEIHLVPLDTLILQMLSLGLTDIRNFPFLERPEQQSIDNSIEKLKFLGALKLSEQQLELTQLGDILGQLPVDLIIGKMLILSTIFNNLNLILTLASLLSVQNPLTQNAYRNVEAQELRRPYESSHGDPITLINYYREWLLIKKTTLPESGGGNNRNRQENSRNWCKKRCLEEQRFYEVTKLVQQFRNILEDVNLVNSIDPKATSNERSIRYGELKQLKRLHYTLKNDEKHNKQRKLLKFNLYDDCDDSIDQKLDIRDVEFHIINDYKRLNTLINDLTKIDNYKDLMIVKLILTNCFYPQLAIEDEFNKSKTITEYLYHTKQKNYVFLRPLSYYQENPEILILNNNDIDIPPNGYFNKLPLSKRHQLLVYQQILETKKPYIVNLLRVPAIKVLLLFSKNYYTNLTLTKFMFDDFLLIDCPYYGQGKVLLLKSIKLRIKWQNLLNNKLKQFDLIINNYELQEFIDDLINFINLEISYNIKRLLPADLKDIYNQQLIDDVDLTINPFDCDFPMVVNQRFGGLQVTENLIYSCLKDDNWAIDLENQINNTPFVCDCCKLTKIGWNLLKILQHESICGHNNSGGGTSKNNGGSSDRIDQSGDDDKKSINLKSYHCNNCDKDLFLSPVDVLKHRKSCK